MLQQLLNALLMLILVSACTFLKDEWPHEMPPRSLFIKAYQQDTTNNHMQSQDEYLRWVQRFYMGWEIYRNGWSKTTNQLLEQTPEQNKNLVNQKMHSLGLKISQEWAKKSKQRRVFTRHVAIWGNALLEALDRNEVIVLIDKVDRDVEALLHHQLEPKAITENRYYPQDKSNPFL